MDSEVSIRWKEGTKPFNNRSYPLLFKPVGGTRKEVYYFFKNVNMSTLRASQAESNHQTFPDFGIGKKQQKLPSYSLLQDQLANCLQLIFIISHSRPAKIFFWFSCEMNPSINMGQISMMHEKATRQIFTQLFYIEAYSL